MTIRWKPATAPNIVLYQLLYSDTGAEGPFSELVQVMNLPMGPNWNADESVFFYDDPAVVDVPYRLYRMSTIDALGTVFIDTTSTPFADGNDPYTHPVQNTFPLDADYGSVGALTYITPDGDPIEGATIRVYTYADWEARNYSKVVGLTRTTSTGAWLSPILVEPGNTFVVQYHLPNVYGPQTVEITV